MIIDHVSTSWAIDENLSVAGDGTKRVTVQYSLISEGLDQTGLWHDVWNPDYDPGGRGHHGYGSLIKPGTGDGRVTFHHNLWSNNANRNPAVGTYTDDQRMDADLRNNVLYNNRSGGYTSGESQRLNMNYVGNYVVRGPEQSGWRFSANTPNNVAAYVAGNMYDGTMNGVLDGHDDVLFQGDYVRVSQPLPMEFVTTDSAIDAFANVTGHAGAFFWNRDTVDQRLIREILSGEGSIIDSQNEVGGYPVIEALVRPDGWDTDGDGMPNWWEEMIEGLDPDVADNNGDLDGNGYTNLEEYLHHQAMGPAVPEPGALGAAALGGIVTLARYRRHRPR
ncbi:MAG: hypothetical protein R3C10_00255 [Pirellulales bacterium]